MEKAFSSLPSWERGLKSVCSVPSKSTAMVAPLVGAWIEIDRTTVEKPEKTSLPSWERGLKYRRVNVIVEWTRRSPRGSVD